MMKSRFEAIKSLALGAALVLGFSGGGAGSVFAQDDEEVTPSHPAHIHMGDCANLDPTPTVPLNNVEPKLSDSDDEDANSVTGVLTASPVLYSENEEVEFSFDDMLAESHSINVHESDEDIQTYIACGEIGGVVIDDELVIVLHPVNDSGHTGVAILTRDGDGNVDVQIYLAEPVEDNEVEATPAS